MGRQCPRSASGGEQVPFSVEFPCSECLQGDACAPKCLVEECLLRGSDRGVQLTGSRLTPCIGERTWQQVCALLLGFEHLPPPPPAASPRALSPTA